MNKKILIIDNYDSFVYNLARYVVLSDGDTHVVRNDALSVEACLDLEPAGIILSPGPKAPGQAGICLDLLAALPVTMPLLGVCLGHQCLVEFFGGQTVRAQKPMHGEASLIIHRGEAMFTEHKSPLPVGRYHSLISTLPIHSKLTILAHSEENEVMAVRHQTRPLYGVQFHPESVLTPSGLSIVRWFVDTCRMGATENGVTR